MSTKHPLYEMMVILKPDLGEKGTKEALAELQKTLGEHKAEISHVDDWGKRQLAYEIKGYGEGYYHISYFTMPQESIDTLEKDLLLMQNLMRHIILKFPKNLTLEEYLEETGRVSSLQADMEAAELKAKEEKKNKK